MKTIIIVAGQSSRMYPLPNKNLLKFAGIPLIIHLIYNLQKSGINDFIVVANKDNQEKISRELTNFNISGKVVIQPNLADGMAGGVLAGLELVDDDEEVFIHNAQDFVDYEIYQEIFAKSRDFDGAILAKKVEKYFPGGYLKINEQNKILSIVEKPGAGNEPSDLVNIVAHFFQKSQDLREALQKAQSSRDDVYEVALQELFTAKNFLAVEYDGVWQAVKFPHHVLEMTDYFLAKNRENKISNSAKISPTAILNGAGIIIEDGVRIFDYACISGPCFIGKNSVIGNNALVRNSMIGENCEVGFGAEVARSYLSNYVSVHSAYVGDSVVGKNVNFGAYSVTTNLRLDKKTIKIKVKDQLIDTGRDKLGCIVGENSQIGSGAKILPGRVLSPATLVGPNEVYK